MTSNAGSGPLASVRVMDFSRLMPFSYSTQLLVDAGATVVKVEAPGGEYGRGMPEAFRLTNRGKRSVTLDLRAPEASQIVRSMLDSFDVVFESFRPGFMDSLGLGYTALSALKPSLVYCSATGYGQTGPYADRAGHDINYAALGGLLQFGDEVPNVPPVPFIDMAIGWVAAFGIAAAVVQAHQTGVGRHVDVSMADVALSLNLLAVAQTSAAGNASPAPSGALAGYPWPSLMLQECPCYGTFRTLDGRFIALANVEPKFWRAFLVALDRLDLEEYRFSTGAVGARVRTELQKIIEVKTLAEWDGLFSVADVCYAPVNTPKLAVDDAHYSHRGTVRRTEAGSLQLWSPVLFSAAGGPPPYGDDIPEAGEANEEMFGKVGRATKRSGNGQRLARSDV